MKKLSLALFVIFLTTSAFSQEFDLGVKFGFNSSKLATTSVSSISNYTKNDFFSEASNGYNIGAFARIGIKKFFIQPELLYSMKKGQTTYDVSAAINGGNAVDGVTQNMDIKSLEIPVLLGIKLAELKLVSVRAFTGPAMTIILDGSKIKINNSGSELEGELVDKLTDVDNFKNNAWDWQLGAAIDIAMFTIDARYSWGLTNLFDGNASDIEFESKGDFITVSLGFRFL